MKRFGGRWLILTLGLVVLLIVGGVVAYLALAGLFGTRQVMPASTHNSVNIYGPVQNDLLYPPVRLDIDPMEALLLVNFEEDPDVVYLGFEPQLFDDPVHGQGMIVIGWRRDRKVDVYHQPGLRLSRDTYDIAGDGLNEMVERPLADAYYRVTESGVDAYFAFDDLLGRSVEVAIREENRRQRRPFGLLAPMGNVATNPSALPLVLLHDFYFVRQSGTTFSIRVDGRERKPDSLPLPIDGTRMYFTRYSPDPLIATLNPAWNGPLSPLERTSPTEARLGDLVFDLVEHHGRTEFAAMRHGYKDREVRVYFTPPLPNPPNLTDGARSTGHFTISADPSVGTVIGEYEIARQGDRVNITMIPSQGWRPNEDKLSVRLIYAFAPDFNNWPKTYRWTAELDLTDLEQVTMQSAWQRINRD
jgi:hypothetical protein